MTGRPADLPEFKNPPVIEVVLSLQFETLAAFRTIHMGLLWNEFRNEYPKVTEQPPLDPVFETFGAPIPQSPRFQIEELLSPPIHRHWFESDSDGSELIQVQQNRFIHNWRKRDGEYPRYEPIRDRFEKELTKFQAFLDREKIGPLRINQCEVTYRNGIEPLDKEHPYKNLERITPLWTGKPSDSYLSSPEQTRIHTSYVLREKDKPYGRIHVSFMPAIRTTDNTLLTQLEITSRGRPESENIDASLQMLNHHRENIVRTFASVTTPEMHKIWGRK